MLLVNNDRAVPPVNVYSEGHYATLIKTGRVREDAQASAAQPGAPMSISNCHAPAANPTPASPPAPGHGHGLRRRPHEGDPQRMDARLPHLDAHSVAQLVLTALHSLLSQCCAACAPQAAQPVTAVGTTMTERGESQCCVAKREHV